MILSVAVASTIKIICENVEPLRPIAVLMSGSHQAPKPRPEAVRVRETPA